MDARSDCLLTPTVLVVDDNEAAGRTLALCLGLEGFAAISLQRGSDALHSVLTRPPDAVVLDLHLADNDVPGFVVLESLRAGSPNLPVIAVTGWYLHDADEADARALGVSDYLFKPVDGAVLVASLRAALTRAAVSSGQPGILSYPEPTASGGCPVAPQADSRFRSRADAENTFILNRLHALRMGLKGAFSRVADDVITDSVEDALLEFLGKVKRGIWPSAQSLDAHLHQAAWRNVANQVQIAARRRAYEARCAGEQPQVTWPCEPDWPDKYSDGVMALAQDAAERQGLRHWFGGETSLRIAEGLGISHLTVAEQIREVKRFKDRIAKRAARKKLTSSRSGLHSGGWLSD